MRSLSALKVNRGVHFTLFAILAFLACASQWSIRKRVLFVVLVAYAVLTETFQWMVPERKVELLDLVENLTGLLAGAALWTAAHSIRKRGQ
jgi:VanZ family protein